MAEAAKDEHPLNEMKFPEKSEPVPGFVPSRNRSGPVPVERIVSERQLPERTADQPIGEWPSERDDRMRSTAENIGMKLATVRGRAREIGTAVQDKLQEVGSRLRIVGGRAATDARDKAEEIQEVAAHRARVARTRAQWLAHEHPLEFIGVAAAAGFLIGFMLRIFQED